MTVLMEAYKLVPCGDMSVDHMDDYESQPIPEFVIEEVVFEEISQAARIAVTRGEGGKGKKRERERERENDLW